METTERLENMIGRLYVYEGASVTIKDVKMRGEIAVIITGEGKQIEVHTDDLKEELKQFKEVSAVELMRKTKTVNVILDTSQNYEKVMQTLLDTIDKVDKDPQYIGQADAINNTVKSIVEFEKVRISMLNLLK
jgi:hypothetical protein